MTNYGQVYEFVNNGGVYSKQVLYSYANSNNAVGSFGFLKMDAAGNLFDVGGDAAYNTYLVELVKGSGGYTEKALYSATSGTLNLYSPFTLDANDDIFMNIGYSAAATSGAVIELVNSGGVYSLEYLYSFTGGVDGYQPMGPLRFDAAGNIYGATQFGGNNTQSQGAGTIFALVPGAQGYQLQTLYTYNGTTDGGRPESGVLLDQSGNIFVIDDGFYNNAAQTHSAPALLELVNQGGVGTTTVLSANPSAAGLATPITLTATVTSASQSYTPSGTVTFSTGGQTLGSAPVTNGVATVVVTSDLLGLGADSVTASFVASSGVVTANSAGATTVTVSESNLAQVAGGNTFSGDQTVNGAVIATSFSGNGAGLTNVTASSLNCIQCVGNTQLGVNYAGSSSQGGPATSALTAAQALTAATATTATTANNALELNGLPASAYALAGSNSFSGDQTVTGNVTTTGAVTSAGVTTTPTGTATAGGAYPSSPLTLTASTFNSTTGTPEPVGFALEATPVAATNNTASPTATLNLLAVANGTPTVTGLSFNADGTINFAANQKFPIAAGTGNGTITAVTAGAGLAGGGTSGNVTLSLAPKSCPAGTALTGISASGAAVCGAFASTGGSNTFTGPQVIQQLSVTNGVTTNAVTVTGPVVANTVTIGGGTPVSELVSVTIPVTLPALAPGACVGFQSAAVTGFTPGATDTFAVGVPSALTSTLHQQKERDRDWWGNARQAPSVFLSYQAWETGTATSPTIGLDVCNPSNGYYGGGFSGTFRVDIVKH